jgi:hypothetical protein
MAKSSAADKQKRAMKVLSLGLPRTGSLSMAEALTALGYENVFHGIWSLDRPEDWEVLHQAADALFPSLDTYNGKGFTRDDWDVGFGHCEALTDVHAPYAPHLIKAYPEAKVILVERDYDKWWTSVKTSVIDSLWGPIPSFFINHVEPIVGTQMGVINRKIMMGWAGVNNVDDLIANARNAFDRHHRGVRELVPKENLLIYRMGQGWEPICEFLGKPVPNIPFPHANESTAMKKRIVDKQKRMLKEAASKVGGYALAAALLGVGAWVYWS